MGFPSARLVYLMPFLTEYMQSNGYATIHYDEADCDGMCLAEDVADAVDEANDEIARLTAINAELVAANARLVARDAEARDLIEFMRVYVPDRTGRDRARAYLAGGE